MLARRPSARRTRADRGDVLEWHEPELEADTSGVLASLAVLEVVLDVGTGAAVVLSGEVDDSRRGIPDEYNTADILGGRADTDDASTSRPSTRTFTIALERAREQLGEGGTLVTYRGAEQPTGRAEWNAGSGKPTEDGVIVTEIGEVDPDDTAELEEYLPLSGFKSVEEWREAIGVADDEDDGRATAGMLSLVVDVSDERADEVGGRGHGRDRRRRD